MSRTDVLDTPPAAPGAAPHIPARHYWLGALSGWLAALAGLVAAQVVAAFGFTIATPLVAVGAVFIDHVPPWLKEFATKTFGTNDKIVLGIGMGIVVAVIAGVVGILSVRHRSFTWLTLAIAAIGGWAATTRREFAPADLLPSIVAGVVALVVLRWLSGRAAEAVLSRESGVIVATPTLDPDGRRRFLSAVALTVAGTAIAGAVSRIDFGAAKAVSAARSALRLPQPKSLATPTGADFATPIRGAATWATPNDSFYRIDTALATPRIDPTTWRLHIHGMVDKELTLSLDDLIQRDPTFAWVTLTCVSNSVGGDLVGNAQWSGTRIAPILKEARIHPDADAVLQTSADGFTVGTPIEALTDDRNALLAYGMNGQPLPIEHGFPVRMVVPGLYGYVSATKWLVDLEVTRYDQFQAYWTQRGWGVKGPIKTESRIDTPTGGAKAGDVTIAGVAWAQHTGIAGVEVRMTEDQPWQRATLATEPTKDSWVRWRFLWKNAQPGDYVLQCRATDVTGYTQTNERADVLPDGATGWHTVPIRIEV